MSDSALEILLSSEKIDGIVAELAEQINRDYRNKKLLLVGLLKGSVVFMSDFMRKLTIPCEIDFMVASSYGSGIESSGTVNVTKDLSVDVSGYDVLIVEDVVDSGVTLDYIMDMLRKRNPNSLKLCTLLDKPDRRIKNVKIDYRGTFIPDKFVVGYGLDFA